MNIIIQNWNNGQAKTKYIFHSEDGFSARVILVENQIPNIRDLFVNEDSRGKGIGTQRREEVEKLMIAKYGKVTVGRSKKSDPYYLTVGYQKYSDRLLIKTN